MSTSTDEILNERRLRAAEIALETARRRRFETDEAVRALQTEVADVQAALTASRAARARDRTEAEAEIEVARHAQLVAEQGLVEERERRRELENELGGLRREASAIGKLTRQLDSEARIRGLEAELELVSRRAAEFEYGVRMAAFDAFKLVRELVDRVNSVLPHIKLPLLELGGTDPDRGTRSGGAAAPSPASQAPSNDTPTASNGLDSERLDAALERLRASTPPSTDAE